MIMTAPQLALHAGERYDVCIIGAGAAGITLALQLGERGVSVCLLEAGGAAYSAQAQRLAEGSVDGDVYPPLRNTRMNALGGSTQVWAGWCRPLDSADFEPPVSVGGVGWPFALAELLPCYHRAHEVCGLGAFEYDAAFWSRRRGQPPLVGDDDVLHHSIFHVSTLRFADTYRTALERATTVRVVLHAPVVALDVDGDGDVRGVIVRTADAADTVVSAKRYVLAAGGIENARLLLASGESPERAPGNAHGLVGRFFTDHPFINPGALVLDEPRRLDFYFPPRAHQGKDAVRATLTLPRSVKEAEGVLASALFFHPRYESHDAFAADEVRAFLELRDKLRLRAVPGAPRALLLRAARGPHKIAYAVVRKLLVRDGPTRRWRVRMMFETASRSENRVRLSSDRDALDRPRAHLTWRLGDDEITGMRRSLALFDAAFQRARVGRINASLNDDNDAWRRALEGGKHHMGTTRMHADASAGVVDADCRVHGTGNLYVAGSSVFPSGGYANPTLTIVALTIRLAEHLIEGLRTGSE